MYVVRIIFTIKHGQMEKFSHTAREVVEMARPRTGCRYYEIFAAQSMPSTYLLYEEWDSEGNYASFKASSTFGEIGDKLTPYLDDTPSYTYYSAEAR